MKYALIEGDIKILYYLEQKGFPFEFSTDIESTFRTMDVEDEIIRFLMHKEIIQNSFGVWYPDYSDYPSMNYYSFLFFEGNFELLRSILDKTEEAHQDVNKILEDFFNFGEHWELNIQDLEFLVEYGLNINLPLNSYYPTLLTWYFSWISDRNEDVIEYLLDRGWEVIEDGYQVILVHHSSL